VKSHGWRKPAVCRRPVSDAACSARAPSTPDVSETKWVNLVWSGPSAIEREDIPPIPFELHRLMRHVPTDCRLFE
jgi:hypothetical protein